MRYCKYCETELTPDKIWTRNGNTRVCVDCNRDIATLRNHVFYTKREIQSKLSKINNELDLLSVLDMLLATRDVSGYGSMITKYLSKSPDERAKDVDNRKRFKILYSMVANTTANAFVASSIYDHADKEELFSLRGGADED